MRTELNVVRGVWVCRAVDGSAENIDELGPRHWRGFSAWLNGRGERCVSDNVCTFADPTATFRRLRHELVAALDSDWRDGFRGFNFGPTTSNGVLSSNLMVPFDRVKAESVLAYIDALHPPS